MGRGRSKGASNAQNQNQWKASHAQKEALSGAAHGSELARRLARVKLAEKLLHRAEAESGSMAAGQRRIELADALLYAGSNAKALGVLQMCIESDAKDELHARWRLVPLLLRLQMNHEARDLINRWTTDDSTVMKCCRLLLCLSDGKTEESALRHACEAVLLANSSLCWLLAAPHARHAGCDVTAMPQALVDELRELRGKHALDSCARVCSECYR